MHRDREAADLGGSDWSGFGWSQETAGDLTVWSVIATTQGGTRCPHSTASLGPRTPKGGGAGAEEAEGLEGQG